MTKNRASLLFLLALTAVALCFAFIIMKPFLKPIVFASALAIVFYPLNTQVRRVVRNPNGAALLSTFLVVLAMIIPSLVLGQAITRELTGLYQSLSGTEAADGGLAYRLLHQGEQWMNRAVQGAGLTTFDVRAAMRGRLEEATTLLLQQGAGLLGNLMSVLLGAVVRLSLCSSCFERERRCASASRR